MHWFLQYGKTLSFRVNINHTLLQNLLDFLSSLYYYYYYYYHYYCYYYYYHCYCFHYIIIIIIIIIFHFNTRNRYYRVTFKLDDIHSPKFCIMTLFIYYYKDFGNGEFRPRIGTIYTLKKKQISIA